MNFSAINTFLHNNAALISYIAFLLTVANFVYIFIKDKENKRRWEVTNLARLIIKDLRMVPWRKLPRIEFENTNWGYHDIFGFVDADEYGVMNSEVIKIPASLVAIDSTGKILSGTNAFTINELTTQLLNRKFDLNQFTVVKLFRICFAVENTGATIATQISIQVICTDVSSIIPNTNESPIQVLQPGERTWTTLSLIVNIGDMFPKELHFQISIKYLDVNKSKCQLDFIYIFERSVGTFRRG